MAAAKRTRGSGRILVGTGGWSFAPWRGLFYPPGLAQARELQYMAARLGSVEINSTFYGPQKPATFQRWHDATPDDFVFAVKGPRVVSNRRDLATAGDSIVRFLDSGLLCLGEKLGPINWQLAPSKSFSATEIEAFLALLPAEHAGHRLRHAIEVRHASFAVPGFVRLARRHDIAIVLAGDAEYPQIADQTASFAYLRVMGSIDARPQGYARPALAAWAKRARSLATGESPAGLAYVDAPGTLKPGGRDVFFYFISGAKRRNPAAAMALLEKLRSDTG